MSVNSSEHETSVEITLPYKDIKTAVSIWEATEPDNQETPPDTTIHATTEGATLHITIITKTGMATLIATVDDLLSCIQAAEQALQQIE